MRHGPARRAGALAVAIRRNEWELAALLLLEALTTIRRTLPPGAIDDVLELLSQTEDADGPGR